MQYRTGSRSSQGGVARTPTHAFLGYSAGADSRRIARAESRGDKTQGQGKGRLLVDGAVTVFDGFAVFNEPVRIQIADRIVEFQPDSHGLATTADARFRVKNANAFGVVRGGLLEFELEMPAADWTPTERAVLAMSMDEGRAHHVATLQVRSANRGRQRWKPGICCQICSDRSRAGLYSVTPLLCGRVRRSGRVADGAAEPLVTVESE